MRFYISDLILEINQFLSREFEKLLKLFKIIGEWNES